MTIDIHCPQCDKAFRGDPGVADTQLVCDQCGGLICVSPHSGPCPKCKSPYLVEKRKGEQVVKMCPSKECGYSE